MALGPNPPGKNMKGKGGGGMGVEAKGRYWAFSKHQSKAEPQSVNGRASCPAVWGRGPALFGGAAALGRGIGGHDWGRAPLTGRAACISEEATLTCQGGVSAHSTLHSTTLGLWEISAGAVPFPILKKKRRNSYEMEGKMNTIAIQPSIFTF